MMIQIGQTRHLIVGLIAVGLLVSCVSAISEEEKTDQGTRQVDINGQQDHQNSQESTTERSRGSSRRGGRMLDLDVLAGDLGKAEKIARDKEQSGHRQSRILTEDIPTGSTDHEGRNKLSGSSKKKLEIKGFIPILSVGAAASKEGKQFDSLDEATEDSNSEEESVEPLNQQQQLKNQLMANFGGQTSMGHASFASPTDIRPTIDHSQKQPQWSPVQQTFSSQPDQSELERSRKLTLGGSSLLSGPKRLVSAISSQVPQPLGFMNHQMDSPQPLNPGSDCICVPFYQCKNGHLSEWQLSKNQLKLHPSLAYQYPTLQQQTPRALNHLNGLQPNDVYDQQIQQQSPLTGQLTSEQLESQQQIKQLGPQEQQIVMNQIYEELRKNLESGQMNPEMQHKQQADQWTATGYGQLDERNANSSTNGNYGILERGLLAGLQSLQANNRMSSSSQQRSCGIMRTCCKLPNSMLAPHLPTAIRGPQNGRLSGFNPPMVPHAPQSTYPQSQLMMLAQNQQPTLQQPAMIPMTHAPINQGIMIAQKPNTQISGSANFMSGRCGVRETLGITGRVQNTNPSPGSETLADFGEFPAHVAILKRISAGDSLFVCSAVLISNQWIATAAHCVRRMRPEEIKVRLGEWDVSKDDEFYPYVESNVRDIVIHPEFQPSSLANDLALLRMDLSLDAQATPHIAPACLAHQDAESFAGQRCWITGWGKDAFGSNGQYQSQLKKVDLPVFGRGTCEMALRHQTKLGRLFRLHHSDLCAGGERGKDACEGDGGAGLYCIDPESGITRVLGIVSWGVGCGQRGVPGVYTSIPALHAWIEAQVSQSGEENVYVDRSVISERSNERPANQTASMDSTTRIIPITNNSSQLETSSRI